MCLFTVTCLFFLPNMAIGLGMGRYHSHIGQVLKRDIQAGLPPFILAERHIVLLDPSTDDVTRIALLLRQMQQMGIPQFRSMALDPAFREVVLPSVPVDMNQVMWHNGVGYSYADDPGQASVDFAFTEPRFVYAIRLKISYGQHTSGSAAFRMSWGTSDQDTGGARESRVAKVGPA